MATGKYILDLPEVTALADADVLEVQETTSSTQTARITKVNLLKDIQTLVDGHLAAYNPHSMMSWKGLWAAGAYAKNDVARDGSWTMVAIADTTDRAAPQNIGSPVWALDPDSLFSLAQDRSIVTVIHKYTMSKSGYIESLAVYTPSWSIDTISKITLQIGSSITIFDNPILTPEGWTLLGSSSIIAATGTVITVEFAVYEASSANQITGGWTNQIDTGVPASQNLYIESVVNSGTVTIDHLDLDSTDRTTELRGVATASIMRLVETGDTSRSTEIRLTSGDLTNTQPYSSYTYEHISEGSGGPIRTNRTTTVTIDVPITVDTQYSSLASALAPPFASLSTALEYGGVDQVIDPAIVFGINISFQESTASSDWQAMAYAS